MTSSTIARGASPVFALFLVTTAFAGCLQGTGPGGAGDPLQGCLVESTFEGDDEGWATEGDAVNGTVRHEASGGEEGGYVTARDAGRGPGVGVEWSFDAPEAFLGNRSAAYLGTLSFHLRQDSFEEPIDGWDVWLIGDGKTLRYDFGDAGDNPGTTWTSYEIPLTEAAWVPEELPAPEDAFLDVLSDLDAIRIRGEFDADEGERTDLDSVCLAPPPERGPSDESFCEGVSSTFDTDSEGWAAVGGTPAWRTPGFVASGGRDGGYITDWEDQLLAGETWHWDAPPRFLGDQSQAAGQLLAFSLRQDSIEEPRDTWDVLLKGAGTELRHEFGGPGANPNRNWTDYRVRLDARAWQTEQGEPATRVELEAVLADLSAVRILGDYDIREGTQTDLDQVCLGTLR